MTNFEPYGANTGSSLGDILADAIKKKEEETMTKLIDIDFHVTTNDKKIEAIKQTRTLFGLGLAQAKELVESVRQGGIWEPTEWVRIRLNETQFVNLVLRGSKVENEVHFDYINVERVPASPAIRDYSAGNPYA